MGRSVCCIALLLAALAAAAGCAKEVSDPIGAEVDYSSPKSVLGAVFYAAKSGDTRNLSGLCDPAGEANGPVRRICAVTRDSADWASFRANFARGTLNGEPRMSGDHAELKFLYGPEGGDPELMNLVRRDGRWYLESF